MFKTEVEHLVPGLNNLIAILEERRYTHFNVLASPEEEYVEEINLAEYI